MLRVTTYGIRWDYACADGTGQPIDRGDLTPDALEHMLRDLSQRMSAPDDAEVTPPTIVVAGPAATLSLIPDNGQLYAAEPGEHVLPDEAIAVLLGHSPVPGQANGAPARPAGVRAGRWLAGFVVAAAVIFFGFAGGVALIKHNDEQMFQVAGVVTIVAGVTIGAGLFRVIRGPKQGAPL